MANLRPADRMMMCASYGGGRAALQVLMCLAFADGDRCCPKPPTLERQTGLSRSAVYRGLKELDDCGVIERLSGGCFLIHYSRVSGAVDSSRFVPASGTDTNPSFRDYSVPASGIESSQLPGFSPKPPIKEEPEGNRNGTGRRTREELWTRLMALYTEHHKTSGGSRPKAATLTAGLDKDLVKCLRLVSGDDLVHLLAYWLLSPSSFWRDHRPGPQLLASLLRSNKVSNNVLEARSWEAPQSLLAHGGLSLPGDVAGSQQGGISVPLRWILDTQEDVEAAVATDLGEYLTDLRHRLAGNEVPMAREFATLCGGAAGSFRRVYTTWRNQCFAT